MSTQQNKVLNNNKFAKRFADVCGTSKPSEVVGILNISYQAAKNYLSGKIPNTPNLVNISAKTSCSIDWLLMGRGKKFIAEELNQNTLRLSDEHKFFIRDEIKKVFAEMSGNQSETVKEKVIVLKLEDIKEEKVINESPVLSLKKE